MKINRLFFNENELLKLRMIEYVNENFGEEINYSELADEFYLSYHQVVRCFEKIQEDCLEFFPDTICMDLQRGSAFITDDFPDYDAYRAKMLKDNLSFLFLCEALKENPMSLTEFYQLHGVSRATFYKKTSPLINFAKEYYLKFSYEPITLSGNEFSVRQFFFALLYTLTKGHFWPFDVAEEEINKNVRRYFDKNVKFSNVATILQMEYVFVITYIRVRQKNFISFLHKEEHRANLRKMGYTPLPDEFLPCKEEEEMESMGIQTLLFMYSFSMATVYTRNTGEVLPPLPHGHAVSKACDFLLEMLEKEEILTRQQAVKVRDVVFYVCTVQYYIGAPFIRLSNLGYERIGQIDNKPALEKTKRLLDRYQGRFEDFLGKINVDYFSDFLVQRIDEFLDLYKESGEIKIGLDIETIHPYFNRVMKVLDLLPNTQTEFIKDSVDQYDFIIYTNYSLKKKIKHKPQFHIQAQFTIDDMIHILSNVEKLYAHK